MNRRKRQTECPISNTLDILGDKWSLVIIRDLIFANKRYYTEFLESEEGISTNILAARLKQLEAAEIITKSQDSHNKVKFVYQLTEKGIDLLPMMLEMVAWAAKYVPGVHPTSLLIKNRLETDRSGLIAETMENLK